MTGLVVGAFYRFWTQRGPFAIWKTKPISISDSSLDAFCLICPVSGLGVAGLFKHGGLGLVQYGYRWNKSDWLSGWWSYFDRWRGWPSEVMRMRSNLASTECWRCKLLFWFLVKVWTTIVSQHYATNMKIEILEVLWSNLIEAYT